MVRIPEGLARKGSLDRDELSEVTEKPMVEGALPPFYLSRTEVTVDQFTRFVGETGYKTSAEEQGASLVGDAMVPGACWSNPRGGDSKAEPSWPVEHVSIRDVDSYLGWAGLRLPTEWEWEYAARGTEGRRYPWGDEWKSRARGGVAALPGPSSVGLFPDGASPFGLLDMAGNVEEWVNADFKPHHPSFPMTNFNAAHRVIKGGCWMSTRPADLRSARRQGRPPDFHCAGLGFRVASY